MNLFSFKNLVLDLLFPRLCFGCRSEGSFLCSGCHTALRAVPPQCFGCGRLVPGAIRIPPGRTCASCAKKSFIYGFLSPFSYQEDLAQRLIRGLKYQRIKSLGGILAELLGEYLARFRVTLPPGSLLVPIPLHHARQRIRGFNQAEVIGRELAGALSKERAIECAPHLLQRKKNTVPQVELSGNARKNNMRGAFAVPRPEVIYGKTIILLDDVKTTGATLEEAARVLKAAGAKKIWAITVAH